MLDSPMLQPQLQPRVPERGMALESRHSREPQALSTEALTFRFLEHDFLTRVKYPKCLRILLLENFLQRSVYNSWSKILGRDKLMLCKH